MVCQEPLTVKHILIMCKDFNEIRNKYYMTEMIGTLFRYVPPWSILEFMKETGLFKHIWAKTQHDMRKKCTDHLSHLDKLWRSNKKGKKRNERKTHAVTALIWPILVGRAINNMNEWMNLDTPSCISCRLYIFFYTPRCSLINHEYALPFLEWFEYEE